MYRLVFIFIFFFGSFAAYASQAILTDSETCLPEHTEQECDTAKKKTLLYLEKHRPEIFSSELKWINFSPSTDGTISTATSYVLVFERQETIPSGRVITYTEAHTGGRLELIFDKNTFEVLRVIKK